MQKERGLMVITGQSCQDFWVLFPDLPQTHCLTLGNQLSFQCLSEPDTVILHLGSGLD